jgi:hypothetical protein
LQDDDGRWWIFDEHQEAGQTIEYHADIIQRKNDEHNRRVWQYYADPGGDTMPTGTGTDDYKISGRRRLNELGIYVQNANKDMMRGIEHVLGLMRKRDDGKPSLFISQSGCPKLVRQLMAYRWETTASKVRDPAERPRKQDDHGPDALRYMIYSMAQSVGKDAVGKSDGNYRIMKPKGGTKYTVNPMAGGGGYGSKAFGR